MPEFYSFLRKCIDQNKTNFELYIGTNGMKISETLLSLLDHFKHVCFSFSFDGYKKVNDYIRWGSDFDTIVTNSQRVRERGFKVALQTVFSTFSISRMHEVFQFYDQEYPDSGLLVQVGLGQNDIFMPFNHPCPDLVIDSMRRCQETNMYYQNGRSIKSMVDLILAHYLTPSYNCNNDKLQEFYQFNDKLDQARNSNLADYIPELAEARKLYNI
jgi:sulfatase maturation enzyme AslB (radical SAM superfamily)